MQRFYLYDIQNRRKWRTSFFFLKRFFPDCINIKFCRFTAFFNETIIDSFTANIVKKRINFLIFVRQKKNGFVT